MALRFFEGKDQANAYKSARPNYPRDVFDAIFKYCEDGDNRFKMAVDIACGTGHQSTLPLLPRFRKVIGVEVSEEQLKQAPKDVPKLEFRQSKAENLSFLAACSVDLVTVSNAVHWFDIPQFFSEMARILVPGGCLAVYGYGAMSLQDPEAQDIIQEFFLTYLNPYKHERVSLLLTGLRDIQLPFPDSARKEMTMSLDWSVEQICSFLSSTSMWAKRKEEIPDCDGLEKLNERLRSCYEGKGQNSQSCSVQFPVTILLGRKPRGEL